MTEADLPSAILDSCVLYPPGLKNLFMWLATEEVFVPKWTAEIHEEWIRNTLKEDVKKNDPPRLDRTRLERTRDLMNQNAMRSLVTDYERHIPNLIMPDLDDRHVLAAAIESGTVIIVTFNQKHFPKSALLPHGIEAIHPDTFLCELYTDNTPGFMAAVSAMLDALKNPPRSLKEQCASFARLGLSQLVKRLES
jgi:predicted nucleic acid-binding protein